LPSFTISTEKAQYGTANKRNEKEKGNIFFITEMSLNDLLGMGVVIFIELFFFLGRKWREEK
jgi:hypothetical protein